MGHADNIIARLLAANQSQPRKQRKAKPVKVVRYDPKLPTVPEGERQVRKVKDGKATEQS
jgi:hypothetical protein